jgi:predicted chitinase
MIKSILKHKKTIGATSLLFLFIVLIDQFIRMQRVNTMIQICTRSFGELDSIQKNSIQLIVQAFDQYGDNDFYKLIYILATTRHESNFRPIKEYRAKPSQTDIYNRQNRYWYSGYYGRGFVQLTWERNYKKMSDVLGVDLVKNPDLALQPNYAAKILVYGMMHGLFTRKALAQYINSSDADFYNARKTVNGLDRADRIKGYAYSLIDSKNKL